MAQIASQTDADLMNSFCEDLRFNQRDLREINFTTKGYKKWQANYIAPLQLPTLATFRSWGSSAGAGRVRPAAAKIGI